MGLLDDVELPRKTVVLFFVINTSGSMSGSKIKALNHAFEELHEIRELSDENADTQIKIAVLEYSTGARWITADGPVEVDKFRWNNLDAGGICDFGAACKALNEKLSAKAFMRDVHEYPIIILLSNNEPTDDWARELATLKQNKWFDSAFKVAIAIGENANHDILKEFTGNMETVLGIHNVAILTKMIKFVSVRASQAPQIDRKYKEAYAELCPGDVDEFNRIHNTRLQEMQELYASLQEADNDNFIPVLVNQQEIGVNIQRITANLPKIIAYLQGITTNLQGITSILHESNEEIVTSHENEDEW